MEGSSAPAIGSRRFAAWANRGSAAQLGIHGAKRRERPAWAAALAVASKRLLAMKNKKIPIHDKDCELWQGKRCTCIVNPHLTEKAKKVLKEKGYYDNLYLEDTNRWFIEITFFN